MEYPHQPCPFKSCGSSDAFSWNDEGYGKCHSCDQDYPHRGMKVFDWVAEEYPLKEKTVKEVKKTTFEGIRGIDPDVCSLYNIQLQLAEDGTPVRYAFKYPTNVKYRMYDEKKFSVKEKGVSINDLFGPEFNANTSKRIYITEGEFDAASLYQILGKSFPVKSLPSASFSEKFFRNVYDYLNSFEEVVYAGELDAAGTKAADRLYQAMPEKFYYVPMTSYKDANEFLMNGAEKDLLWSARKPQRYSPVNFFCSEDEFLKILREENPYESIPIGHSGIDNLTRGVVKGGLTFLKAPPGSGKTELIRYFERGVLSNEGTKVAKLHMEEMKSTTLRADACYELGKNVRTKEDQQESGVTDEQLEVAVLEATKGDRTIIFEMMAGDDPMKIVDYCRLAISVYGADVVFIDHVQRLAYLFGIESATNNLTEVSANLAQMCKDLNAAVVLISHVNDNGRTKYASSLEEEAIIVMRIERDKESEDDVVRNTTKIFVEKNRPFAKLGDAGELYYDVNTTLLSEPDYTMEV